MVMWLGPNVAHDYLIFQAKEHFYHYGTKLNVNGYHEKDNLCNGADFIMFI